MTTYYWQHPDKGYKYHSTMKACRRDIAQYLKKSMDYWNEKFDNCIIWSGRKSESHGYVGRVRTSKMKVTYWRSEGKRGTVYTLKADGTLGKVITGKELAYINKIENEMY